MRRILAFSDIRSWSGSGKQAAGYPESGKQTAGYPDPARMEKLFYSVFNLEEVNLKLKFSTIHQNCQYPAGYPDSGKQSAGYPAGYPDPADHRISGRISGIRWRDQILIRSWSGGQILDPAQPYKSINYIYYILQNATKNRLLGDYLLFLRKVIQDISAQ